MVPEVRAAQLIELACSSQHDNEARSAALTACRLIKREGLRVVAQLAPTQAWAAPSYAPDDDFFARWWEPHGRSSEPFVNVNFDPEPSNPETKSGVWRTDPLSTHKCYGCKKQIERGQKFFRSMNGKYWCNDH